MDVSDKLDEFESYFRKASLPDTPRQNYEQMIGFVDASNQSGAVADLSGELAGILQCKLDLFFPVADRDDGVDDLEELISEQKYDQVQDVLRNYERLEGEVQEAILDNVPGEGDETLCLFPAPFRLAKNEEVPETQLGDVIEDILGEFDHPTLLFRDEPYTPPELYDNVTIIGSTLHNILRLIRCTAGVCPDGTNINVLGIADKRFVTSMKELLKESKDFSELKDQEKLHQSLHNKMNRELRQVAQQLDKEHDITLNYTVEEATIQDVVQSTDRYFETAPTLLGTPLHYSGGGYDTSALVPFFKQYPRTDMLVV